MTEKEKTQRISKIIEELENRMTLSRDKKEIHSLRKKINSFTRINLMREKMIREHEDLKKKYLIVTKERNAYFGKLNHIEKLGVSQNWEDGNKFLSKIKDLLENAKREL